MSIIGYGNLAGPFEGLSDGGRQRQIRQYQLSGILTANPGSLVVMLYDGLLRNLRKAILAGRDDPQGFNGALIKAQAILGELISCLDLAQDRDIAGNLMRLYFFINGRLVEANVRKTTAPVEEVLPIVEQLGGAWKEVVRGAGKVAAN